MSPNMITMQRNSMPWHVLQASQIVNFYYFLTDIQIVRKMPENFIQPVTDRQQCFTCHKTVTGKRKLSKCSKCHAITYCGARCQKADWPRHISNCIPVMVTEYEGKGRGLVAARDIKMGEFIFLDKPAIKMPICSSFNIGSDNRHIFNQLLVRI